MTLKDTEVSPAAQRPASSPVPAAASEHVRKWVDECVTLCQPDRVHWCDGSAEERQTLLEQGVRDGVLIRLNQQKLPGCFLHRSNPNDAARTEQFRAHKERYTRIEHAGRIRVHDGAGITEAPRTVGAQTGRVDAGGLRRHVGTDS